jgi:hypothetical protein
MIAGAAALGESFGRPFFIGQHHMGYIPPPAPLSKAEFERRWQAGARSMEELDPAFAAWCRETNRLSLAVIVTLLRIIAMAAMLAAVLVA